MVSPLTLPRGQGRGFPFGLFLQGNSGGGDQGDSGQGGGNADNIVSAGVGVGGGGVASRSGDIQGLVREDIGAQSAGLQDVATLVLVPLDIASGLTGRTGGSGTAGGEHAGEGGGYRNTGGQLWHQLQ